MDDIDRGYSHPASAGVAVEVVDPKLRAFMIGVYNKVALGLLTSAGVAYLTSSVPMVRDLLFKTASAGGEQHLAGLTTLGAITAFAPVLAMLCFGMKAEVSAGRARLLYWSVVTTIGASLGVMLLVYTTTSIATAFAASAAGFGALSLWGYTTGEDLKPVQTLCICSLIGLLAVMGLNLLLHSPPIGFVVNAVGVIIFAGLIAYDTQRLKAFYHENQHDTLQMSAGTDIGALSFYLDFVNLFQFLLAFTGGRR